MKFKIEKDLLEKGIQTVQNVAGVKSALPILANMMIEAQKGSIRFTATDLDVGIQCTTLEGEVIDEGATTIPAKKISDIIRELPDGMVTIATKKNDATTIECGKAFFRIMGLPKDEFPKIPEVKEKGAITVEQPMLKTMINMTSFAVSHDETRYILNGILFVVNEKFLRLVATDGRRLALIQREFSSSQKEERRAIVPTKAIYELNRILKDDGKVKVSLTQNQVSFQMENVLIISRLIEGDFPNYEQVIPKETKDKLMIGREELLLAARRASLLTSQDSLAVKMDLLRDKLVVSKYAPDVGESKEELVADYKGESFSVGFNPAYLIDVLKNMSDDEIGFELNGPEKPGVIRTADNYLYMVLPIQLK